MSAVSSGYIVPYFSVRSSGASNYPYRLLVGFNCVESSLRMSMKSTNGEESRFGKRPPFFHRFKPRGPLPRYILKQNDLCDSGPLIIIRKKGDCEQSRVFEMPCAVYNTVSDCLVQFFFILSPRDLFIVKSLKSIGLPS